MNWRETSVDERSESPSSLRRRISEPRVEEDRRRHSHWLPGSSREGPVTNGLVGSSLRDHYYESSLYENKHEKSRKLSLFCQNFQQESPSTKFRWENLFAKNPANASPKSLLGFDGCDGGANRGIRVSGSQLCAGSSSKDVLEGCNLFPFQMNIGATKESNVNNGDIYRSHGIRDYCRHFSSSTKFDESVYEPSDAHVRDRSHGIETLHLQSSARVSESKRISQDVFHGYCEGRLPPTSLDSTWKKGNHREPVETEHHMEGLMEHKQVQGNYIEHFDDHNQSFKVQPSKRNGIGAALNTSFTQQMVRIPQDEFYQDSMRTSVVMDPVIKGFEDTQSYVVGKMEEPRTTNPYDFYEKQFTIEGLYRGNDPLAMEQDGEVLGSGIGSPLRVERDAYQSSETLLLAEEDGIRINHGDWKWSNEDGLNGSLASKYEKDLRDMEDSRKRRWKEAEHSTKSRVEGTRCGGHYPGSGSSRKPNVFSRIQFLSHGDEKSSVKDIDINLNCRNKMWNSMGTSISSSSSKQPLPWVVNHVSDHSKKKCRDLKKRLREPSSSIQIKEREQERKRNKHLRKINVNYGFLDVQAQAGDCFEEKTQSSTSRPLEDPEVLNQLIKTAFLKFVKVLSENSARRKKFIEPRSGIIKCIVCGSNSKEFGDAQSLSQHAFQTLEASKVEHLGLHKALCWLMGWSSEAAAPNGVWVRRILPLVEAIALKEDLIIWPPVLIIHNSSIAIDNNTSEQEAISCEELEVVIRGMGCVGKLKVVRGKPGNQSIMVATFDAMFTGLQEAERLHKSFADKKHGRDKFRKINSRHTIDGSHNDLHKAGENRIESALYGYLGLAEDLDKLDFETKKRSVVKSKKEIQAIVDASLHC